MPLNQPATLLPAPDLPAGLPSALWRGMRFCCPRCGSGRLFRAFLKPVACCHACAQDWTLQRADDFPAYIAMVITGHLLAPVMIVLARATDLGTGAICAVLVPLAALLLLGLLQPAKGAVIALQWWFGMHGFTRERRGEKPGSIWSR